MFDMDINFIFIASHLHFLYQIFEKGVKWLCLCHLSNACEAIDDLFVKCKKRHN